MKLVPRISRVVSVAMAPLRPQRLKSRQHLAWLKGLRFCAATGRRMVVDPHHLMHMVDADGRREVRGQRKWGDETAIPVGHDVHDILTRSGQPEEVLRARWGVLHRDLAAALFKVSGDDDAGFRILAKHLDEARLRLRQDEIAKGPKP